MKIIALKIAAYVILLAGALFFGLRFYDAYNTLMADSADEGTTDLINVAIPNDGRTKVTEDHEVVAEESQMTVNGLGFFVCMVFVGLIAAHDFSTFIGGKAVKALFNEEGEGVAEPDYEQAEEEWAKGNHMEAITMMRGYLKRNPRQQHVALRIAEIYEKDMHNNLAAALEYEEVLKQRLPRKRWGWAAIHLCNLYFRMNRVEEARALLERIAGEYSETPAAEKARKRLALMKGEEYIEHVPVEESDSESDHEDSESRQV